MQYSFMRDLVNASMILLSVVAYSGNPTQENEHSFQSIIDSLNKSSSVIDPHLAIIRTKPCFNCSVEAAHATFDLYFAQRYPYLSYKHVLV